MSLKIKLVSIISAFILVLSMLLVGVFAAGSQTINLKGNVQFDITDSSLYVKDIRLMNSIIGGNTLESFVPGFVNESFDLNLGQVSSTSGSITIELDIVNTADTTYSASTDSIVSNASIVVSGTIAGDSVPLDDVATYEGVSGTITITITLSSGTSASINLDNIVINLIEYTTNSYTVTINIEGYNNYYYAIDDAETFIEISRVSQLSIQCSKIIVAEAFMVTSCVPDWTQTENTVHCLDEGDGPAMVTEYTFTLNGTNYTATGEGKEGETWAILFNITCDSTITCGRK